MSPTKKSETIPKEIPAKSQAASPVRPKTEETQTFVVFFLLGSNWISMAVFLINVCKFNGCGLTFPSLGDLIQHIEFNHIGKFVYL